VPDMPGPHRRDPFIVSAQALDRNSRKSRAWSCGPANLLRHI
jgi:hypothetical protein